MCDPLAPRPAGVLLLQHRTRALIGRAITGTISIMQDDANILQTPYHGSRGGREEMRDRSTAMLQHKTAQSVISVPSMVLQHHKNQSAQLRARSGESRAPVTHRPRLGRSRRYRPCRRRSHPPARADNGRCCSNRRRRAELGELERWGCKVPVAGGQRHVGPGDTKANNIRHAVAVHIRQLARILVVAAPTAGAWRRSWASSNVGAAK